MAGLALVATIGVGGLYRQAGPDTSSVDTSERAASVRVQPAKARPATTTTTAPTTTTTAPTTATTAPSTTTAVPAPTTAKRTATTKAPATSTTAAPAPVVATPPAPTPAPAVPAGNLPASTQQEMLSLVNAKRASGTTCGGVAYGPVPALSLSGNITAAADAHATDMATNNYFSHTGVGGSDPGTRMGNAGYAWSAWAENIAAGQTTAASVVSGWFSSAGHCVNFMSSAVTQVGFGMADNPASSYRYYWVADLGRPA